MHVVIHGGSNPIELTNPHYTDITDANPYCFFSKKMFQVKKIQNLIRRRLIINLTQKLRQPRH